MRYKAHFILVLFFSIVSCSKSDNMDAGSENNNSMEEFEEGTPAYTGSFVSDAHPTSGTVTVSEDLSTLTLTNFRSDSGPILELYLATTLEATEYVTLGVLQGLDGNYTYELPENVNFSTHTFVIVWCVDFSVSFGHAVLE